MTLFLVPIVVDHTDTIIAGHGRLAAAKELGLRSVPVIRAGHLSPHQVQAFRIADNHLGELSSWNKTALALELKGLAAIEVDPEILDLTAFEAAEVHLHIHSLDEHVSGPDKADTLPEPGPAVSQAGDLWIMGAHRLLCASSLESESYERLLRGRRVRAVWSDPPYNVAVSGHVCGLGQVQHREFAMASGEMSEGEFAWFLASYLALAKQHSLPASLHYVCMDGPHALELPTAHGGVEREQGIGKAGNRRLRSVMVELAWLWQRYQPGSAQVTCFRERVGSTGRRIRKVMVVALARKLPIALWRFVVDGVLPEGATMKPAI